jgi:hypothetical protein
MLHCISIKVGLDWAGESPEVAVRVYHRKLRDVMIVLQLFVVIIHERQELDCRCEMIGFTVRKPI